MHSIHQSTNSCDLVNNEQLTEIEEPQKVTVDQINNAIASLIPEERRDLQDRMAKYSTRKLKPRGRVIFADD
ncbi:hypothetical protein Q7M76_05305 [Candidatus Liberibacter asiaticus]|uniref:Uncharacterized protein n=2 Tax=Liberibacter asiaticus TaxID=34021 RepID=C6XH00_LIBAP|nr:hypothetical protein [Candidatus Liberibacter asiaticus]ACT57653.1 hypothetical protein CLIBASIA_05435 [Candidatus Liberibacter asiaticus str. psy62]AGH17413.1 hypothetical protein WSI_05280 [Candidatus Liberibacter asiaticus str. gxpsy]ALK07687.1 hypothetical protein CD16_05265 [Candidatus Liberibacter asiaticus]ASK53182.1 hypothetical protein B2I23_05345 [Candidatus Liberibacter asiaticus]AWL14499.1 hypothetical protein DIC79_05365 [Candidatus Liberibacter asiaticus]